MKTILLKISGEFFLNNDLSESKKRIMHLVSQIKSLHNHYLFGIVVGGGNLFRGSVEGKTLGLKQTTADAIGMLATVMNSLVLHDCFVQQSVQATVLSSIYMPQVVPIITSDALDDALRNKKHIIFAGGTSNPYLSTDTNAAIRALQVGAQELWKATKVDYVYDSDPKKNSASKPIRHMTHQQAIEQKIGVMDLTALALAQQHNLSIRVFNIFTPDMLCAVARDETIGSIISPKKKE